MIIDNGDITIYFGDKNDPFSPKNYLESYEAFGALKDKLQAKSLTFLEQTHSSDVHIADHPQNEDGLELFQRSGDALIINRPGCAIGVMTADCLPIVLHDPKNNSCAVIHAGWRGSVANIVGKAINKMSNCFDSKPEGLIVYFGPSAKVCCYEIGEDFRKTLAGFSVSEKYIEQIIVEKDDRLFFDNILLNKLLLKEAGVLPGNICTKHNVCTICDSLYHSYRRDKDSAKRQTTVVVLR